MATATTPLLTAEEFEEWSARPENQDKHCELDRGEIIEMPPPGEFHGVICFLIARLLGNYIFQRGKGYICTNDAGLLVERNPDTVRGPDIMLFDEQRRLEDLSRKFSVHVPTLVVEVLSPNDQKGKTDLRITQYLKRGVPLVWIVDPEVRTVSVHRPGQGLYVREEGDEVNGEDVLPDLRYQVDDFFALPGQ